MSDKTKFAIMAIIVLIVSTAATMWFWPWFVRWCLGQ